MCDERTYQDNLEFKNNERQVSRRQFNKISAGAGLAIMLPPVANAQEITSSHVEVTTPDGIADCYYTHPVSGSHAAVIIWPDIFGLRPAFETMGDRLAQSGYAVLVVNPFYRLQPAPTSNSTDLSDPENRNKLFGMMSTLTAETNTQDAEAFVTWLDAQKEVDTSRGVGTTGYCMGGPLVMRSVAAVPHRFRAGATFHGGGLATDDDSSPHLLIPETNASMLHAIAAPTTGQVWGYNGTRMAWYDLTGYLTDTTVYTDFPPFVDRKRLLGSSDATSAAAEIDLAASLDISGTQLGVAAGGIGPTELDETASYDFTSGAVDLATQTAGDNTTKAASTAFVTAAVPNASYRTILQASASHIAGKVAGTYGMGNGDPGAVSGTGTLYPLAVLRYEAADYPTVNGAATKLRVRANLAVNDVALFTGTLKVGLYPVTRPASSGGTGVLTYTIGTLVTGSEITFTNPAADSHTEGDSGDFTPPSDGYYILAYVTSATVATNSLGHVHAYLQQRNA